MESALHRLIEHAPCGFRRWWRRAPRLSEPFRWAFYAHHVIHRRRTFRRDFVTQYLSHEERRELDRRLQGSLGALIRRERYGLTLRGVGLVMFNLPILPFLPILWWGLGSWGVAGTLPG